MSNPMKENAERIYSHTVTTELNGIDEILEFFQDVKRGGLQAILDVEDETHHGFITLLGTYPKLAEFIEFFYGEKVIEDSEWISVASKDDIKKVGLTPLPFAEGAVIYWENDEVYCNLVHAQAQLNKVNPTATWEPGDLQPVTRDDVDKLPDEAFKCVYCGTSVLV
jgi:hypothetical protein